MRNRAILSLLALFLGAAGGLVATPAAADITKAAKLTCTLERMGRCKDGECRWRAASERDRSRKMVVDFTSKRVSMTRTDGKPPRGRGNVYEESMKDSKRLFVVARSPDAQPTRKSRFSVSPDGKFTGARGETGAKGRQVRFEGTCVAG